MTKRSRTAASEAKRADTRDLENWTVLLGLVDYKPGWQFHVLSDTPSHGSLAVRFKMLVWDSLENRDLKPIVVTTDYQIPASLYGQGFSYSTGLHWLCKKIKDVESHEVDEWFRFDGLQCFNPHGQPQMLGRRVEGWEWFGPQEVAISPTLKERNATTSDGRDLPGLLPVPQPGMVLAERES